jgi:hypothetical protein
VDSLVELNFNKHAIGGTKVKVSPYTGVGWSKIKVESYSYARNNVAMNVECF